MKDNKLGADIKVTVEYFPDKTIEEIRAIADARNKAAGHGKPKGD